MNATLNFCFIKYQRIDESAQLFITRSGNIFIVKVAINL